MTPTTEFHPNWASAPGETILDIIEERGLSVDELANEIRQTPEETSQLLQGRATITIRAAKDLERVLGGSVEFWMARDFQFREDTARLRAVDRAWLNELPLRDMIRFGWLQPAPRPEEEVDTCLRFFGVRSVIAWRLAYEGLQAQVAFRTSSAFDSHPAAVAAWLRQGERVADTIPCEPWDRDHFTAALSAARGLTSEKDPARFLPALRHLCSSAGVAVAVVRAPNGCRASGATRFISSEKALLLLSFRYLSDDQFWFTFFHEAAHLLLHGHDSVFVEGLDAQGSIQEKEANDFAEDLLIPAKFRKDFLALKSDTRVIIRFAKLLGIAPGIVVGQLQHYKKIPRNHLNGLKRRFEWLEGQ